MKAAISLSYLLGLLVTTATLPLWAATSFAGLPIDAGKGGVSSPAARQSQRDADTPPAQNGSTDNQASQNPRGGELPQPARVTLSAGTTISVRVADAVDSSHGHVGDLLTGTVDPSVLVHDQVVIPRGTEAHVRMVEDKKGGHLHGKAKVELELMSLVMNGQRLDVQSGAYTKQKGAIAAKAGAVASPGTGAAAEGAADVALAANPAGAVAAPAIAVFRSAKVDLPAGTRVPFTLIEDFSFDKPAAPSPQPNSP